MQLIPIRLAINSNLGSILPYFRDMASFPLNQPWSPKTATPGFPSLFRANFGYATLWLDYPSWGCVRCKVWRPG